MNKDSSNKSNSLILERINALQLSEAERLTALGALQDADQLVDAFARIARKIERIGERLFLKPSLKH